MFRTKIQIGSRSTWASGFGIRLLLRKRNISEISSYVALNDANEAYSIWSLKVPRWLNVKEISIKTIRILPSFLDFFPIFGHLTPTPWSKLKEFGPKRLALIFQTSGFLTRIDLNTDPNPAIYFGCGSGSRLCHHSGSRNLKFLFSLYSSFFILWSFKVNFLSSQTWYHRYGAESESVSKTQQKCCRSGCRKMMQIRMQQNDADPDAPKWCRSGCPKMLQIRMPQKCCRSGCH